MRHTVHTLRLLFAAICVAALAACSTAPAPAASQVGAASVGASAAPSPTSTSAPSPTAAATATSQPTSTLVPTAAPSPTATATAEPQVTGAPPVTAEPAQTAEATTTTEPTATSQPTATSAPTPTVAPTTPASPAPSAAGSTPGQAVGGRIAFVRDGGIVVFDLATRAITELVEDGRDMQFSRDGAQLAFVRDDGLYLAQADGTGARQIAAATNVRAPRWADDGTKLLYERSADAAPVGQGEIWTIELPGGAPVKVANGGDPAWAPDGKRIAYVTAAPDTDVAVGRRNQLRLTNWRGQNGWPVVSQLPANTPPTGIPGSELTRDQLLHVLFAPAWDAAGKFIHVPALAAQQVETDFTLLERADAVNGGATYLTTVYDIRDAVPAPDHSAVIYTTSSARGDISLATRALDAGMSDAALRWAQAGSTQSGPTYMYQAPTWAPSSAAIAAIRCEIGASGATSCALVRLAQGLETPEVLVPNLFGTTQIDFRVPLFTAWVQ